jgi:hypothetical protein
MWMSGTAGREWGLIAFGVKQPSLRKADAMPRYFFNVHDGEELPDAEGTQLGGVEEAKGQAIIFAGEAIRELGHKFWSGVTWAVEVSDESGETLFTLKFVGTLPPG